MQVLGENRKICCTWTLMTNVFLAWNILCRSNVPFRFVVSVVVRCINNTRTKCVYYLWAFKKKKRARWPRGPKETRNSISLLKINRKIRKCNQIERDWMLSEAHWIESLSIHVLAISNADSDDYVPRQVCVCTNLIDSQLKDRNITRHDVFGGVGHNSRAGFFFKAKFGLQLFYDPAEKDQKRGWFSKFPRWMVALRIENSERKP